MSTIDDRKLVSRRTLAKGAAWATPGVVMLGAAPRAAASDSGAPSQFSSWGTQNASVDCGDCRPSGGKKDSGNKYTYTIDNTYHSGLSYHGVLFPGSSIGDIYTNIINIYYFPFTDGTVNTTNSTSGYPQWTPLAYTSDTASYPTIQDSHGVTYYPWITQLVADSSGTPASVTSTVNGVFHVTPDYKFTVKSSCTTFSGTLYAPHSYSAYFNGSPLVCTTPVNNNYCGMSGNQGSSGTSNNNWRNNGWNSTSASCSYSHSSSYAASTSSSSSGYSPN